MLFLAHQDPSWILLGVGVDVGMGLALVWREMFGYCQ